MAKTIDEALGEANSRLKSQNIRLTIQILRKSLWLRGTFPARPSSGKTAPHRQRLSLGIGATFQGIKLAEAEAQKISEYLCHSFQRLGIPFSPQKLRHAYCIRGILYGLPAEIGAAWAGHALDLHNRVYQRWIQEGTHKAIYDRYILGK